MNKIIFWIAPVLVMMTVVVYFSISIENDRKEQARVEADEEFRKAGERFIWCDGLHNHKEHHDSKLIMPEKCLENTSDFMEYINDPNNYTK